MNQIPFILFGLAVGGGLILAYILGRIVQNRRPGAITKADVIMIFGAAVWSNGPSISMRLRVARGAELYQQGYAPMIFCSGGWSNGQSEAAVMRGVLLQQGIPSTSVIPDDGGVSTRAALRAVKRFGGEQWHRVIAVSSPYHLYRIRREARRQEVDVITCPADNSRVGLWPYFRFQVRQYLREMLAVLSYEVSGRIHHLLDNRLGRIAKAVIRQIRGRFLFLFRDADLVADSSEVIAQHIKTRVAGFSDTTIVMTPASGLNQPVEGLLGDRFGLRYGRLHAGVDFRAAYGSPVVAAGKGKVLFTGNLGPYGNIIIIYHGGGLSTVYGHLAGVVVMENDKVSENQQIGYVGETGRSFGPHLHFEVRIHGSPVEPLFFLSKLPC